MDQLANDLQFFLGQFDLKLLRPDGLWLLAAIPVFFVLGFWMGKDLHWLRRGLVQLLRAVLILLLAAALSHPVKVSKSKAPAVVMLADLSDSMGPEVRGRMEERLQQLWSERGDAATYLVGFGAQPVLLAGPDHRRISLPDQPKRGSDDSNLAAALRFAYGLLPAKHDWRALLVSDGEQTRGDALAEAHQAREFGLEVSVLPMMPPRSVDVRVEALHGPGDARAGESFDVDATLYASAARRVRMVLRLDGKVVTTRRERLKRGINQLQFPVTLAEAGWHKLELRIWAGDRYRQNNKGQLMVHAAGKAQVLVVQERGDDNPLRRALEEVDGEIQTCTPGDMPKTLAELNEYELVLLEGLKLTELDAKLVEQLKIYVEEYGGGLVVTVGKTAADLAGPEDSPIEDLLPLHFRQVKKKEQIPAALVFVMDRSSSMSRGGKFSILLRAVADTLDRLKDNAQISMIMFDDFPEVVVPLTEARHRKEIRKVLLGQRMGGGTSIYPALEQAEKQLKKSAAKLKHVILLSDGQSISIFDHYGYVVDKMVKKQITVTTVALGEDADQEELKRIAGRSGGRFYYTTSMSNVPKIFTAETENITESNEVEQPIHAVPVKTVQVLAGLDFEKAPVLGGYVASEARPTSEVLLASSDRTEPLLARWRFGLGQVLVWSSDALGAWAGKWPEWEGYGVLWPRLIEDSLRRNPPGDVRIASQVYEDQAVVTVRVPAERPGKESKAPKLWVQDPKGKTQDLELVRRGLGLYRAELPMRSSGAYALRAERKGKSGAREVAYASLSRDYRAEYLSAEGNLSLLMSMAQVSGGKVNPTAQELFAPGRQDRETTENRWPPLLLMALGVFLLEIMLRRL